MTNSERDAKIKVLAKRVMALTNKDIKESDIDAVSEMLEISLDSIVLKSGNGEFEELKRLLEERDAQRKLPR